MFNLYHLTANQGLCLVAFGGLAWVCFVVFMDNHSAARDRDEYRFDLVKFLTDLLSY